MAIVDTSDRRQRLVEQLRQEGFLSSPHWCEAFRAVPREAFVRSFAVPSQTGASTRFDLDDDTGAARLTVTADGDQWLWLDEPDNPVLDLPAGPGAG